MQFSDDRDVQALLGEQNFNVAPAPGSRNSRVEQRLSEKAAGEAEGPDRRVARAFAALNANRDLHSHVWVSIRAQDQAAPGRLFQRDPRLGDLRIFFERRGESGVEGERMPIDGAREDKAR